MLRIIGLAVFLLSIPLFQAMMRGSAAYRRAGWFAIGIAPFLISQLHLQVSIIEWALWPGYVKGIIVSLLDSLALAVVVTERETMRGRPLLWPFVAFLIGSSVANLFASPWLAGVMWTWQTARVILVFVAVSMVAARPEGLRQLIGGLAAGAIVQAGYALYQRAHGVIQVTGTMGHQNLLGLSVHFALFLCLAAMLAGDRRWLPKLGVAASIVAVMLSGSRATVGLDGAGVILLIVLSLMRRRTAQKVRVATIGLAMLAAATPVALLTLQTRFATQADVGGYDERRAFENAAKAMWSDHPLGVGANTYVVRANKDGYNRRAGVVWTSGMANVHNTYLLIAAETGPLGLATFLTLMAGGIVVALRLSRSRPRGASGEIALGGAVTLMVVAVHCLYEWVFVTWLIQYLFAIAMGIVAGMAKRQRLEARERAPRAARAVPEKAPGWSVPVPA